jgi:endonuclease/exonuclease/phosphatase family metal-dependent hydrolase
MKILSLNCQRGHQSTLEKFLRETLENNTYDFLLLQEVDTKVLAYLQNSSYKLLRLLNYEVGIESELCIAYRNNFDLLDKGLQSFSSMRNDPWHGFKHPSFGFLWGEFRMGGEIVRLGSIHLHSGVDQRARMAELQKAREILLENSSRSTIIAGDFNAGFPGEAARFAHLLAPEFAWITRNSAPTLDSRYSENVPHLPNRIAAFLRVFNLAIKLRTDHVFMDADTARKSNITCLVLADRVSDHNPVELSYVLA